MHFSLIDRVLARDETSLTAVKHVSAAEEYLQDHFPEYPVLPGVMMLEAMVQAARELAGNPHPPLVLTRVSALKYGAMVRPGDSIVVTVTSNDPAAAEPEFRGEVRLLHPGEPIGLSTAPKAASGKITLRPVRADTHRPQAHPPASIA